MKMNKISIFLIPVLALVSCSKDQIQTDNVLQETELISTNEIRACIDKTVTLNNEIESLNNGKTLARLKLWENGITLTVRFLGGSRSLQDKVMNYAKIWEQYANIKLRKVTSGDSHFRVSFEQTNASWSFIGKDANFINQNEATMNFGWFNDSTEEDELKRTTLHEFGHALGAIHEHQSPLNEIQWNKPVAYEYYANENGWNEDEVDANVFDKYDEDLSTNSEYDPDSIMHYPIDAGLTLDGYSVAMNYDLSAIDKSFIGETYPFDEDNLEEPEPTENGNLALGKETSQISLHKDLPGESSRAVDGNTSGKWHEGSVTRTKTEMSPWWQVRLGQEYSIGDINIWNRIDDCCAEKLANFDVFVYNDAGQLVYKTTVINTPNPNVIINAGGAIGSRVRIKLKETNQLSLAEVQVYEF